MAAKRGHIHHLFSIWDNIIADKMKLKYHKTCLQEARTSEDIHDFVSTDWAHDEDGNGVMARSTSYEVTLNLGLTTASIKVEQKHVGGLTPYKTNEAMA
jgi:hypothetical protein